MGAQETGFLYQGELLRNGLHAEGQFDFQVSLYASGEGESELAPPEILIDQPVRHGVFFLALDFGDVVTQSPELWLDVQVRRVDESDFAQLAPRWQINPLPRALLADLAGPAAVDSAGIVAQGVQGIDLALGAVGPAQIDQRAVTNLRLQDGSIGRSKIQSGGVGVSDISSGAVGSDELADSSVTATKFAVSAVGSSEIADNAVGAIEIAVDGVTQFDLAVNAVGADELAADSVWTLQLADSSVGLSQINAQQVQRRVSAICPAGQSMQLVQESGDVFCAADSQGVLNFGMPSTSLRTSSSGGSAIRIVGTVGQQFCQLSSVDLRELDNADETGRCALLVEGSNWVVEAFVTVGRDAMAFCEATCQSIIRTP